MAAIERGYGRGPWGQVHFRACAPENEPTQPPLVCIHSTPSSGHMWEAVLPPLATGRRVIAPDTPGYGMSDPPPSPASIPEYARALLAFVDDTVATGPVDLMGFHTGSIIAVEAAVIAPERVRRIVLFGLAAYDADVRAAKLAALPTAFPPPGDDLTHVEKLWAIMGSLADPRIDAATRHRNMAESLRTGTRLPWGFEAVYRHDFIASLGRVQRPVLVMNPEDDLWEPTRTHAHRIANARRHDMPGVKHGVLALETDRIVPVIDAFLREERT